MSDEQHNTNALKIYLSNLWPAKCALCRGNGHMGFECPLYEKLKKKAEELRIFIDFHEFIYLLSVHGPGHSSLDLK